MLIWRYFTWARLEIFFKQRLATSKTHRNLVIESIKSEENQSFFCYVSEILVVVSFRDPKQAKNDNSYTIKLISHYFLYVPVPFSSLTIQEVLQTLPTFTLEKSFFKSFFTSL